MRIKGNQVEADGTLPLAALEGHGFALQYPWMGLATPHYVDANNSRANDSPKCGMKFRPWATLAYAVKHAAANSLIIVNAGHTETIAGDTFAWANAGVKVIGVGAGNERPTFTFITAAAAKLTMDKANCALINLRFINGVDSQTTMILLSAAAPLIADCFFQQGDATTQAASAIFGNASYDNAVIIGNKIITTTDTGGVQAIETTGTPNNVEIANNFMYGDFSSACIHNTTGNVLTLLNIHHNILTNLNDAEHAIELVSACTGVIAYNAVNCSRAAVGTLGAIDPGSCYCIENYGSDGVGDVSGLLNPAADA